MPADLQHLGAKLHINIMGKIGIGGPVSDCGLTGPMTIVDIYDGMVRHVGDAFSWKYPLNVDRSSA